jgi:hypothetical protein
MDPITLRQFHDDAALRADLFARARAARSQAVHDAMARLAARIKWALHEIGSPHVPGRPAQG